MPFTRNTTDRLSARATSLARTFDACLNAFERAKLFSGPSVYFHKKTIERRYELGSAAQVVGDTQFLEFLYGTLASWGMHRMGNTPAKMAEFDEFAGSIQDASKALGKLEAHVIGQLEKDKASAVADELWTVLKSLRVGTGEAKLVAGTKTVHHVLPDLVPPMDREYTLRFFFHHKNTQGKEAEKLKAMLVAFNDIARRCDRKIAVRLGKDSMHTSRSKVLDNAVVGWLLRNRL